MPGAHLVCQLVRVPVQSHEDRVIVGVHITLLQLLRVVRGVLTLLITLNLQPTAGFMFVIHVVSLIIFLLYSPSGYSNRIFYSPTEI